MGKKKEIPEEELIIPRQDNRICGTICVCQMVAILSCVSIIYLTVAAYVPSVKDFLSEIDRTPVMCSTTQTVRKLSCSDDKWESCFEWCLSKPSGACIQIFVNLRRNGSSLAFSNCLNATNKTCFGIDQETAPKIRCIRTHDCDKVKGERKKFPELMYDNLACKVTDLCQNLTGVFNCTGGNCTDITDAFQCSFPHTDPPLKCSGIRGTSDCSELDGLQTCTKGLCRKVRAPYNCDRRCGDIPTRNKNVIFVNGDNIFLTQCQSAYDMEKNVEVWNDKDNSKVLMVSCYSVKATIEGLEAIDCLNASLIRRDLLADQVNYTHLLHLFHETAQIDRRITLTETDLTISNYSGLKINTENCVNTLMDECATFHKFYANDGSNYNARARYPCYYDEKDTTFVYARFDLRRVTNIFLITLLPPVILIIVSCTSLIVIHRKVVVGDDAKMRINEREVRLILDKSDLAKEEENGDAI